MKKNGVDYMILVHDPVCQGVKSDIFITKDNSEEYQVEPVVVGFPYDEKKKWINILHLVENH